MRTVNPVPDENLVLRPYLIVKGAAEAIAFYAQVFGAREIFRLTDMSGKLGHVELEIGRSRFLLADEYLDFGSRGPHAIGGSPVAMHLYVEDVDSVVARALAAGATLTRPIKNEFFGERTGSVTDPFGHKWHLASRLENVSPKEMQKRLNSFYV